LERLISLDRAIEPLSDPLLGSGGERSVELGDGG
jgi:hypothetical protein